MGKKKLKREIESLNLRLEEQRQFAEKGENEASVAKATLRAIESFAKGYIRHIADSPAADAVKGLKARLETAEKRAALLPSHLVDEVRRHQDTAYGHQPALKKGQVWLTPWNARARVCGWETSDFGRSVSVEFEYVDSHSDVEKTFFKKEWGAFFGQHGGNLGGGWVCLDEGAAPSKVKINDSIRIAQPNRRSGPQPHTSIDIDRPRGARCYLIAHFDSSVDPPVFKHFGLYSEPAETLTADHLNEVPFNVMWIEARDYGSAEKEMIECLQAAPYFAHVSSFSTHIARMLEERRERDFPAQTQAIVGGDGDAQA